MVRVGLLARLSLKVVEGSVSPNQTVPYGTDHYLDTFLAAGELINLPSYHDKLTTIAPQRYSKKPVIAFAGGKYKWEAVRAALRGKWINGLVTDESCALAIAESENLTTPLK